jgi:hypothetical protein
MSKLYNFGGPMNLVFEGSFCDVHGQLQNALGLIKNFPKGRGNFPDMKCDF